MPSVDLTGSALPSAWLEPIPAPIIAVPSPAASITAPIATDAAEAAGEPGAAGPRARRRRWSLRRRRRGRATEPLDLTDPVGLDLVAMGLDDEADHPWSELTVASLEEGTPSGAGHPDDGPWSLLATEPRWHRSSEPCDHIDELAGTAEAAALELETEFWTEGNDMAPGWLQRLKGGEEQDRLTDDEPMEMLDLSAYEVPAERRGAFRDAVAAGAEGETDRDEGARDRPS